MWNRGNICISRSWRRKTCRKKVLVLFCPCRGPVDPQYPGPCGPSVPWTLFTLSSLDPVNPQYPGPC
ncbi:hypothetical protein EYF80_025125 [Liparis tanakae]|uniref:Uncharacterized protein n=1 Tax=Liparis tanakae TaxID=230148 RepID=A0A4Z2HFW8_9TELE|nr:hypothetical protein EYF80_025125 [Liparis tanakae]